MTVAALRWIAVIVPVVAIGVLDLVTDHELSDLITNPLNTLLVPATGLVFALVTARIAFRRIDRLTAVLRQRNAELEERQRENEALQEQLRDLAVRAERARIAREMHDGLAQVLGYVNTKAQAVEELLAAQQVDPARRQLAELAAAARSVYVDTRAAILGLTHSVALEKGLAAALDEYAVRFADASKLAVTVDASPAARATRLGPEIEEHIFRIAQEALTNVRKHAAARRARVALDATAAMVELTVEDDGHGFDLAAQPSDRPQYGMRSIRERAASIDGSARWSSRPGAGTVFRLEVPLHATARVAV